VSDLPLTILPAGPDDPDRLVALIQAAFEEYRGLLNPPSSAHTQTPQRLLREMADGGALIALAGGEPAGCVLFHFRADHLYWDRLAVLPAFRRHGVGRALIAAVEDLARTRGYAQVRLSVRLEHARTRAYYESLDYRFFALGTHAGSSRPTYATLEKSVDDQSGPRMSAG
jgi:GNAT superfamily N-acetyltransferase